jgi:hypothetical protein
MAEKNVMAHENEQIIAKAQDFWTRIKNKLRLYLLLLYWL